MDFYQPQQTSVTPMYCTNLSHATLDQHLPDVPLAVACEGIEVEIAVLVFTVSSLPASGELFKQKHKTMKHAFNMTSYII